MAKTSDEEIMPLRYEPMDPRAPSAPEIAGYNRLMNSVRSEWYPKDPPFSVEDERRSLAGTPSFFDMFQTAVWDADDTLAASSVAFVNREETNQHVVFGLINVLPEYRRQGIARGLAHSIARVAQREGRRLLFFETYDTAPAGAAFVQRFGARVGMRETMSKLDMAQLDRELVRRWIAEGERGAADFALEFHEGLSAVSDLAELAALWNVMNTAPREDMEYEDTIMTPDKVLDMERTVDQRNGVHWILVARHRPTGRLAGFTDTVWLRDRPTLLEQWGTGVEPEFRKHGLGRWLKAAMLERVLQERPQVQSVRTENAGSNAPMLKINRELGFRHYVTRTLWQVETERVLATAGGAAS